jgi:hypothetical protein
VVATIYVVVDPDLPAAFRYVGLTTQSMKRRLQQHIYNRVDLASNRGKAAWIHSLLAHGRQPIAIPLVEVQPEHAHETLRNIRRALIAAGHDLININAPYRSPWPGRYTEKYRADTRQRNIEWRARVRADQEKHSDYLAKAAARKKRRMMENLQSPA